ncbi:MAG: molybdopterin molybdotransferase MoeA [Gemmatimonadota bacterium]|nr:molybdopterin molybdotransferase MoeA [Gemmatimonadota bacterium]
MADFEAAPADWLTYEEASSLVLGSAQPLPAEEVDASACLGRYLAEDVVAGATLPPFANSAMDGYAVRASELRGAQPPISMPVGGTSLPGARPLAGVAPATAIKIMTGGPLPEGFDTVIRVEHTDREASPGHVVLEVLDDLGKHVRPAGQDLRAGEPALKRGTLARPAVLGLLVACGRRRVLVRRQPRVGVLSSGDELVDVSRFDLIESGTGIPDTNRVTLLSALPGEGALPEDLGIVRDEPDALLEALASLPSLDVLITTGGASMGERDLFKRTLAHTGFELAFWRTSIRPGSPFSFGHLTGKGGARLPVFGLPGNPGSAFVTFHVFVAPFLRRAAGSLAPNPPRIRAVAGERFSSPEHLTHFYRVRLERNGETDRLACFTTGHQGSGLVSPLAEATGLAIIPRGVQVVEAGQPVDVILLPGVEVLEAGP